ncbi:MAG: hypothetical protein PHY80_03900 [Rickettsiales bacterium]|nr:hypothetical protein [Rickettsiales bacterium]
MNEQALSSSTAPAPEPQDQQQFTTISMSSLTPQTRQLHTEAEATPKISPMKTYEFQDVNRVKMYLTEMPCPGFYCLSYNNTGNDYCYFNVFGEKGQKFNVEEFINTFKRSTYENFKKIIETLEKEGKISIMQLTTVQTQKSQTFQRI